MKCVTEARPTTTSCGQSPVDIARETPGTPTQKLIAVLSAFGMTSATGLASVIGVSDRAVRKARNHSSAPGTTVPEPQFRVGGTTVPQRNHSSGTVVPPKKEIPPTPPKEKTTSLVETQNPTLESAAACAREKTAAAPAVRAKIDLKELTEKLTTAANGSIAPQALALQTVAIPLGWLEAGADLELDVLPTIEAVGKRNHGAGITSWQYFTRPVAAAVKARKAGLPDVPAETQRPKRRGMLSIIREQAAARAAGGAA